MHDCLDRPFGFFNYKEIYQPTKFSLQMQTISKIETTSLEITMGVRLGGTFAPRGIQWEWSGKNMEAMGASSEK